MSRSGYVDDLDNWQLIRCRGQVASAIRGKRGQRLLRDMIDALDRLPEKKLTTDELIAEDGRVCAIGAVCLVRDVNPFDLEYDADVIAESLDIAPALAREIFFLNDEVGPISPPAPVSDPKGELRTLYDKWRWQRMRAWARRHLVVRQEGITHGR